MTQLAAQICEVARLWPPALVRQIAAQLESGTSLEGVSRLLPTPSTRVVWSALIQNVRENHLENLALALALRVAKQGQTERQSPELVWTGPQTLVSASWRRTDAALLQVIQSAQRELWLVTYAVFGGQILRAALHEAAERGVQIHLVCEWKDAGKVRGNEAQLSEILPSQTQLYQWPRELRARNGAGQWGSLHAKIAVADASLALLSSANLTDCALEGNIESGVLLRGEQASEVARHLRELVENGMWAKFESF